MRSSKKEPTLHEKFLNLYKIYDAYDTEANIWLHFEEIKKSKLFDVENVNEQDGEGNTLLHLAATKFQCHCERALLRRKIVASKLRRCEKASSL